MPWSVSRVDDWDCASQRVALSDKTHYWTCPERVRSIRECVNFTGQPRGVIRIVFISLISRLGCGSTPAGGAGEEYTCNVRLHYLCAKRIHWNICCPIFTVQRHKCSCSWSYFRSNCLGYVDGLAVLRIGSNQRPTPCVQERCNTDNYPAPSIQPQELG
jgi:hypothetical protein